MSPQSNQQPGIPDLQNSDVNALNASTTVVSGGMTTVRPFAPVSPVATELSQNTAINESFGLHRSHSLTIFKKLAIGAGIVATLLVGAGFLTLYLRAHNSSQGPQLQSQDAQKLGDVPASQPSIANATLDVNAILRANHSLVLTPMLQPSKGTDGQVYYDQTAKNYYFYSDGAWQPFLNNKLVLQTISTELDAAPLVKSLGGATGAITLGSGLALQGNQLVNTVASSSSTGTTYTAGNGLSLSGSNVFSSTGVLSIAGTLNQISASGSTGAITLSLPQSIATTSSPTFGGLTLGSALSVSSGGLGVTTLSQYGVVIGNGANPVTVTPSSAGGECLISNPGAAPTFQVCPGGVGSGVNSLNTLAGVLTLANATGLGSTITIDDASTGAKGIAQFNASNFSVISGAVDTIQNIATSSSPTFNGLTLSTALSIANGGTGAITAAGARSNLSSAVTGANNDITSTTALNTITPSSSFTLGAASQGFTLQGTSTSIITAKNGSFTTTIGFVTPTANVTLNFPALTAGTYSICTTSGNCSGAGGGVTTPGGTTGTLPLFSGSQTLGDSIISQAGGVITVAGAEAIQGSGGLSVGVGSSATGKIVLYNSTNNNTLTLQSGVTGSNLTFTLPTADGGSGQCLKTNSSGVLSWGDCLSGAGGGGGGVTALNSLSGTLSLLGTTNQINVSSGGSSITLSTPQDINTTSAPSFAGLSVSTTSGLTLGTASALGTIIVRDGSSAFTSTITPATLTGARTITIPNASGTVAVSASGNIALSAAGAVSFTGQLPIANGGTNANTAPAALANLGAAASGANSDITSLSGLSTALSVAQGGTGAITFASNGVLYGNAAGAIQVTAAGSTGQCLVATTAAAPSWGSCTGTGAVTSLNTLTNAVVIQGTANEVDVNTSSPNITIGLPNDVTIGNDLTVTRNLVVTGTYNSNTFNSSTLTFGAAGTATIRSAASQILVVDSGSSGSLSLGTANATAVGIGRAGISTTVTGNLIASGGTTNLTGTNTTNNTALYIDQTLSNNGVSQYGFQNQASFNPTGAVTDLRGMINVPNLITSAQNVTNYIGSFNRLDTTAGYTGTISLGIGEQVAAPVLGGTSKLANYNGIRVDGVGNSATSNSGNTTGNINNIGVNVIASTAAAGAGGTLNNYGVRVDQSTGSGAGTTNNYGIYIGPSGAQAGNWGFYQNDTLANYLGGALTVGAASGLTLGTASSNTGAILFKNGTNSNTITLQSSVATSSYTLNLPILAAGTYNVCTSSGNCAGAGTTLQNSYANSTPASIVLNTTNGTLSIQDNATPFVATNLFEVANNGASTKYLAVKSTDITANIPVYINGTAPDSLNGAGLTINTALTSTTHHQAGITLSPTISPASDGGQFYSGAVLAPISNSSNLTTSSLAGFFGGPYYYGTGTVANVYGVYAQNEIAAAGTFTNSYGILADNPNKSGGGTITKNAGIAIQGQSQGTNNTNLLIGTTTIPSGNYSIYNASGNTNYFGGVLQVVGGNTADITTPGAASANALALQPGASSGASSNGPALSLKGGDASGTTSVTGGAVNITAGSATGASGTRNGGSVVINPGTGATANGSITVGNLTSTNTINIGSGATASGATQTISVGANGVAGSTTNITFGSTIAGTTLLQGSAITLTPTSAGTITLGASAGSGTITIGGTGVATSQIDLGTGTGVETINLGTGGTGAKTVTVGSTASTGATTVQAGTGAITIQNQGTGAINIANNAVNSTINIGKTGTTNNTSAINIGNTTSTGGASTIQIGGTGVTAGSNTSTTVTLQAGQTSLSLATGGTTVKTFTDSTTAFQIQNAAGTNLLTADTTNLALTSGGDLTVGTALGNRIFSDGFESGNTNLWNGGQTVGGSSVITLDTTTVRNGKYSVKFVNNSGVSYVKHTVTGASTMMMRGYVNITSASTSMDFMSLASTSGTKFFTVGRNGGTGQLQLWNDFTSTTTPSGVVLTTGTWHQVELDVTINATTGSLTVYLDGISIIALTNINTGTVSPETVIIGDGNTGRTSTFYVDDVAVDVVRPGNSSNLNVADSLHVGGTASFGAPVLVQSTYNTTTAFQIQNATGVAMLNVDTSNLITTVKGDLNVGTNFGTRLFSDSFESGNFALWSGTASAGAGSSVTADTTTVKHGKYSAKFVATTNNAYIRSSIASSSTVYARSYVNVTAASAGAPDIFTLKAGSNFFAVYRLGTGATSTICIWNSVTSTGYCSATSTFAKSVWYKLEARVTIGNGSGALQLWINDNLEVSQSSLDTGTSNIDTIEAGTSDAAVNATTFLDDLSISTTANDTLTAGLNVDESLHVAGTSSFGGGALFQAASNSTSAFQIQNAAGTSNLFIADTTNNIISIGDAPYSVGLGKVQISNSQGIGLSLINTDAVTDPFKSPSIQYAWNPSDASSSWQTYASYDGGTGYNYYNVANSNGANVVMRLDSNGGALFKNNTNSTTAFQIQNAAGTSLLAADTTNMNVTINGDLIVGKRADSGGTSADWAKVSQTTAGTIASGGTSSIDMARTSVVYNGSLYIGTSKAGGGAEIYRYDGGSSWTKVSQATAGTIASGGTSSIVETLAMTVYNGSLYIGTGKINGGEVYRYDGGTTWTKVSQATAGTIASGGTANIDAMRSLVVYGGNLYGATNETGSSEIYRYDGGTTWTKVSQATAGTYASGGTASIDESRGMIVYNNSLYAVTSKANAAEVYRYDGDTTWTKVTQATAGTIANGGTANIDKIQMPVVYNGKLYVSTNETGAAEIYRYDGGTNWTKVSQAAAGTIASGGTASIDAVRGMTVYSGSLYVASAKANAAEVYRYDGDTTWTKVSQATAGTLASGGTANIDGIRSMIVFNNLLFVGTEESAAAEVYTFSASEGQSYALKFWAASDNAGSTEQSGYPNQGQITFQAEQNGNNPGESASTGSFIFSNGILTASGAYDVAEDYPTRDDTLKPGDLVSIDPHETGFVRKASGLNDPLLVGVYSEHPALRLGQKDATINGGRAIPVALAGRVPVKVSTENGTIAPGDAITSSATQPGVGVKATATGRVVGIAMQGYSDDGVGSITVFVNPNSYTPTITDTLTGQVSSVFGNLNVSGTATIASLTVVDKLVTKDIVVNGHIIGNADTRGTIVVIKGETSVRQDFNSAFQTAPYVVASPVTDFINFRVESDETGFTIYIPSAQSSDVKFNYLVQQ